MVYLLPSLPKCFNLLVANVRFKQISSRPLDTFVQRAKRVQVGQWVTHADLLVVNEDRVNTFLVAGYQQPSKLLD